MSRPDLSVAIIFKNEIRCLERCLKSLQPLRERFSLQIVMADTGSTDGSRAVAERYADVLFDFPWINDFAAARNAVLDRCRGKWTLVMDCDEWLEADMDELAGFMRTGPSRGYVCCAFVMKNYVTSALDAYQEFYPCRLFLMSAGPRYEGAIHERVRFGAKGETPSAALLEKTRMHHDGYVMLNDGSEAGAEKRRRNMALLRADLSRNPEDLRVLMQILDSGDGQPDFPQLVRRAVSLVKAKTDDWDVFGPPIIRRSVQLALRDNYPEWEDWSLLAWELFPTSEFTRIDVCYCQMIEAYGREEYKTAAQFGETFLTAWEEHRHNVSRAAAVSTLQRGDRISMYDARAVTADAYYNLGDSDRAGRMLSELPWSELGVRETSNSIHILMRLEPSPELDLSKLIQSFWQGICAPNAYGMVDVDRIQEFLNVGYSYFDGAWQLFLPLRGKCILGDAAALLAAETPEEADAVLADIADPTELPPAAFVHALKLGAEFPIPGKTLKTDQIAALAEKLLIDPPFLREAAKFAASAAQTEQEVMWAYALAKVALNQATAELEQKQEEDML